MAAQLERLAWEVGETVHLYGLLDDAALHVPVYPEWDALEVLRHLVWWHESFADIACAASSGAEADVPRGSLAEVNARSVASLKPDGVRALRRRLSRAQRRIDSLRDLPADARLGYRRGGRDYSFEERIAIAAGELQAHRRDALRTVLARF